MTDATRRTTLGELALGLLAGFIAVAVPWSAVPYSSLAFSDDWAYATMARSVAETGTFQFNGWASAFTGPLAYWGALFIKIFGSDANWLRLSVLLLASGVGAALYALGRLCDLNRSNALLASAACTASPVTIPLAGSFMTDVPAMFFAFVGLAFAAAACRSRSMRNQILLFTLTLVAGFVGGMVRQVMWVLVLVAPVILLSRTTTRATRVTGIAMWIAAMVGVFAITSYVAAQPYAVPESLGESVAQTLSRPKALVTQAYKFAMTGLLMGLPVLLAILPAAKSRRGFAFAVAGVALMTLTAAALPLLRPGHERLFDFLLVPWLGNLFTPTGVLGDATFAGESMRVVPRWIECFFVLACAGMGAYIVVQIARRWRETIPGLTSRPMAVLSLFGIGTLGLSFVRSVSLFGFDRYLLLSLPAVLIAAFRYRQTRDNRIWIGWSVMLVTGFAAYGWIATRDYASISHAADTQLRKLTAAGIPRHEISAQFELDCEFQLREWGYLNFYKVVNPPGATVPLGGNEKWRAYSRWSWQFVPSIYPKYLFSTSPLPGYRESRFAAQPFHTMFPPRERSLLVLELIDSNVFPFAASIAQRRDKLRNAEFVRQTR